MTGGTEDEARQVITGIGVCPGTVVGPVVLMPEAIDEPAPGLRMGPREDHEAQARRVDAAAAPVAGELPRGAAAGGGARSRCPGRGCRSASRT